MAKKAKGWFVPFWMKGKDEAAKSDGKKSAKKSASSRKKKMKK